jgi:hypothetical protein
MPKATATAPTIRKTVQSSSRRSQTIGAQQTATRKPPTNDLSLRLGR